MSVFMARNVFICGFRLTVMESWGLNRSLHLRFGLLMVDISRFVTLYFFKYSFVMFSFLEQRDRVLLVFSNLSLMSWLLFMSH
jgi:hypothetical protein